MTACMKKIEILTSKHFANCARLMMLCCLIMVLASPVLASCAGTAGTTAGTTASATQGTTSSPASETSGTTTAKTGADAMSPADLAAVVNGKTYAMMDEAKPLIDALGEPVSYSEAPSCLYEGFDKTYEYADLTIYTITTKGVDRIDGIDLTTDAWQTPRGIKVGSRQADVFQAYGAPFSEEGDLVYITDESMGGTSPRITFVMDGDVVSTISIYSGSNATSG
jgi:hypothetical protein